MANGLDFEKPILELETKIAELKSLASDGSIDLSQEIKTLESRLEKVRREVFESLTPWQKVQIARHPKRPYTIDYINMMAADFIEVHGDRMFQDDKALIGGFCKIDGEKVLVIGHQKGRDTKENLMRNFGSAHPEGYRKAMRMMELAEKFNIPIVTLIDTPGAYPGIGAEERGQANSIAHNLREMISLKTPIVVIVIGEGGSGGALGIGIGDRVYVMENSYYSVISPEGCAAILWKDRLKAPEAAEALKLTAKDLIGLGIIDDEIPEPLGGAHRDPENAAQAVKKQIKKALKELKAIPVDRLLKERYEKYRRMGDI
ncbi:MAG: acetyl-CoA carboxylase carboxyltransferase subunit alpha [Candidatus Omnitrophica bacterium]|nr:acetyl-CoA carboxylase carboxyltransferase subunit alpha [Candidatus Omnitrophota bacterium]MBU1932621.1 acetyl-CoA carboxylase carboxyltransferase subunit alpha [Candidatus Omnitrophota bacterium]